MRYTVPGVRSVASPKKDRYSHAERKLSILQDLEYSDDQRGKSPFQEAAVKNWGGWVFQHRKKSIS